MHLGYKEIDKQIRVYGCNISELPTPCKALFERQLEADKTLSDITVFYDDINRVIVINEEHEQAGLCRDLVVNYIRAVVIAREELKETMQERNIDFVTGIVRVLDCALFDIENSIEHEALERCV